MRKVLGLILVLAAVLAGLVAPVAAETDSATTYRGWIQEMKVAERGPFARIRWFCNDGTVLPSRGNDCDAHGDGYQHGQWSERTVELRQSGYLIANLLAGLNARDWLADPQFTERYAQLLIERYLVGADDGWIFRRALFYRGAIQEEDERAGARALLTAMAARSKWIGPHFAALRAGVRLLPHGEESTSVLRIREMSTSLARRDQSFSPVRAKIHSAPAAEDADRVRRYAASLQPARRGPYLELANEIERVYAAAPLDEELRALAAGYLAMPWLQDQLRAAAAGLNHSASARDRFRATAVLLADLRRALPRIVSSVVRLELLDLSLSLESEHFRAGAELREALDGISRRERLEYLRASGEAAYGTGLINERLLGELFGALDSISAAPLAVDHYLEELSYLGRVPGWGTQSLRMYFYDSMQKLGEIEPLAMLFIQNQLRGSPLLFFSQVLDGLSRDASRLAGVEHRLFDETIGVGFTALNTGLATGVLQVEPDPRNLPNFQSDGIYVLPETVSDLPPVAGILTEGAGNPLSHVQLLARNLGIPNVAVGSWLLPALARHDDERVVFAVSKSGLVELSNWDESWEMIFDGADSSQGVRIEPDLGKLDLSMRKFVLLDELRASDSGRIVGPKAAKLGELREHYPSHVSRGVAIPFGLFRQEVLEQAYPGGDGTVFDWMLRNYRELEQIPADDPWYAERSAAFRAELYDIILNTTPSDAFQRQLREALTEAFGSDHQPGVFVRSDTNVEDLAGFTGAGLNLTLPNVVGFDNLLNSIASVWASPFTARAYAWRQSRMARPEHVYTSILLQESVASDKSGVLVTQDVDSGRRDVISVAVNEGLGGAVDGQAAESLRIALDGSGVRVLATATAAWRRVLDPSGGLRLLPASGSDTVLQPAEIDQLIAFARSLPENFPAIIDDEGHPAPADVEFGFVGGDLRLFQLRPFLESKAARGIRYLQEMEARLADTGKLTVNLDEVPQ